MDMTASVDGLAKEASILPEDQRMTLAHRILSTLEPPMSAEVEEAWDREIIGRIERFKQGESKPIPAPEVFSLLDDELQR